MRKISRKAHAILAYTDALLHTVGMKRPKRKKGDTFMFVYSVRASALRFCGVVVLSVVALVALLVFVPTYVPTAIVVNENAVSFEGIKTEEDRISLLSALGWEVSKEPDDTEIVEVTVPARFDAVYEDYNALQKSVGLDLSRYRGKKVMRYTYTVTNCKDYDGHVTATLLVYKNRVIGGDVCSSEIGGFLQGLKK